MKASATLKNEERIRVWGGRRLRRNRMKRFRVACEWLAAAAVVVLGCVGGAAFGAQGKSINAQGKHGQSVLGVKRLRCEFKVDPVGMDVRRPRLSWELESTEKGVMQ